MKEELIFTMKSPYRDDFKVRGFTFGSGKKSAAVVGPMRGDELQQQFVCSQLVKKLSELEADGRIKKGRKILVVPSVNHFSMNLERRFWALDNTDINRMFPGYAQGETTQRIAAALFERLKGFEYGIQTASYYMPGNFIPHVRIMRTGYEDAECAKLFELPYVYVRDIRPYDTAILNYNWQIWNTKAFSLYTGRTNVIDKPAAEESVQSILRFFDKAGIVKCKTRNGYSSTVISDTDQVCVHSPAAGIFYMLKDVGQNVKNGDPLALILDPYTGEEICKIKSPSDGVIFFVYNKPLVLERTQIFKIIK